MNNYQEITPKPENKNYSFTQNNRQESCWILMLKNPALPCAIISLLAGTFIPGFFKAVEAWNLGTNPDKLALVQEQIQGWERNLDCLNQKTSPTTESRIS